ncbi:uncharacterized protein LOC131065836 [Cryptomeria japonica]|uniref:uncharacterized protein LOC131065836 n=1 Tax=Cryptomeria japonica TaxID=3369 RepID=UPI0025AB62F0|nr:uncharacterized protein LOC131065836 [Cryptomeria japonica]
MAMVRVARAAGCLGSRLWQTRGNHAAISESLSRTIDATFESHASEDQGTFGFAISPWGSVAIEQDECEYQDLAVEGFASASSMQLMAVPKRKVTHSRKRIRNAPKALKPAPLIMRCKSCGRVKLPHFFCCTGDKINDGDDSTK